MADNLLEGGMARLFLVRFFDAVFAMVAIFLACRPHFILAAVRAVDPYVGRAVDTQRPAQPTRAGVAGVAGVAGNWLSTRVNPRCRLVEPSTRVDPRSLGRRWLA